MKLWLDDQRPAPGDHQWARTYYDAVQMIRRNVGHEEWAVASLDHDLGSGPTGYDLLCWMEKHRRWPVLIRLHTANPVGRENMLRVIEKSDMYVPHPKERSAWLRKEHGR